MKIRHLENARLMILATYIAARVFVGNDDTLFRQVNEFLISNGISMEDITPYISLAYNASVLVGFDLEQLCSDYDRIESFYNGVICNTAELIESFGIEKDPVKVFALYVYLYRSGYLSVNKEFKYSTRMKDLPKLSGVDVVRGRGVCRSISSMFTDVCDSVGLTASNVTVRVKPDMLKKSEGLALRELDSETRGKKWAKVVGKVTSILPLGNHLVTAIEHDTQTGIYDPTNDIFMHVIGGRKYCFANDTSASMSYSFVSSIVPKVLGQIDTELDVMYLKKLSTEDRMKYLEYVELYQEVNQLIRENERVFEEFYKINLPYYTQIDLLTREQHGLIKRMIPLIPERRK